MTTTTLLALARAATPGPWAYRMGEIVQLTDSGQGYPLDYYPDSEDVVARDQDGDLVLADRNAEYIAAASPDVIAALCERVEALEAGLREACDQWQGWTEDNESPDSYADDRARIAALRALAEEGEP